MRAPKVSYSRLTPIARSTISDYCTIAEYVREFFPDGQWCGDRCGCRDDRCSDGHHHEPDEECECLRVLLEQRWGLSALYAPVGADR